MTTQYRWKPGAGISGCSADDAASALEELRATGPLTPARVTVAAADPASPLHSVREYHWDDDAAAAAEHRVEVSRRILRSLVVTYHTVDGRRAMPQYVRVDPVGSPARYERVDVVARDPDLIASAMSLLQQQVRGIMASIDRLRQAGADVAQIEVAVRRLAQVVAG